MVFLNFCIFSASVIQHGNICQCLDIKIKCDHLGQHFFTNTKKNLQVRVVRIWNLINWFIPTTIPDFFVPIPYPDQYFHQLLSSCSMSRVRKFYIFLLLVGLLYMIVKLFFNIKITLCHLQSKVGVSLLNLSVFYDQPHV